MPPFSRRTLLLLGFLLTTACSGSPGSPTRVPGLSVKSIRYVRTKPVINPDQTSVTLFVAHASASCFGCQGSSGSVLTNVLLTPTGPDTFEYPFASSVVGD